MGRVLKHTSGRLRIAAVVGAALVLAGCGAGQIAQTAGMEPAVNGGTGQAGTIAVRDVQLVYPPSGYYKAGGSATLRGVIVNAGQTDDVLVQVTSKWGDAVVAGDKSLPAGKTLTLDASATAPTSSSSVTTTPSGSSSSSSSTSPTGSSSSSSSSSSASSSSAATTTTSSAAPKIGTVSIVLTNLAEQVWSGKTIEVTFVFRGGQTTVVVPIATSTQPREAPASEGP
ncbi:hypothetical protein [Actinocrispum wychmicini]|uniref:Copper(I)-binding protein n=1 Tax=Actinocrispum wychmicini TaxID=1213861 RepID=A0A4R2JEF1_9PSEU|nr:hypothetical protein [Actinocrispum wychmicini]TCO58033.1 hypothetical protein EV192_10595 [Actinocrispum wychmicini]